MFELIGLRRKGNEFPLEPWLGYGQKNGEFFFTGIVPEITARKQPEKALQPREWEFRQSQEEFQALGA